MAEDTTDANEGTGIQRGMTVYDADGDRLGVVDSFTDAGFEVAIRNDLETDIEEDTEESDDAEGGVPDQHEPGHEFGEGFLMWRCDVCGEMGEIEDGLPEECPNCGAEKEKLMYWKED